MGSMSVVTKGGTTNPNPEPNVYIRSNTTKINTKPKGQKDTTKLTKQIRKCRNNIKMTSSKYAKSCAMVKHKLGKEMQTERWIVNSES